jgi:hypothetical protein
MSGKDKLYTVRTSVSAWDLFTHTIFLSQVSEIAANKLIDPLKSKPVA